MLLKTFTKHLIVQPISIRHDSYEGKDILEFEKIDGFFPYLEFQSQPKDKTQIIYFDVLNWEINHDKYINSYVPNTLSFMLITKMTSNTQMSIIDAINERLQAFYMLFINKE